MLETAEDPCWHGRMRHVAGIAWIFAAVAVAHGEERPLFLPFALSLGGQQAAMVDGNELFAPIPDPVAADAVLKLEKKVPMLIVNAFACAEDGSVDEATPALVIFARDVDQVKLDASMDGRKLKPGTYLANIVAESSTARIVFRVGQQGDKKADFLKVVEFLKRKVSGE